MNLLKWTTVTSDIDIFEIMTVLIIFSRCNIQEKLHLLFTLFCFDPNLIMCRSEVKFMVGKISCAIAMTFQIKKSYIQEIAEDLTEYILPEDFENFQSQDSDDDQLTRQQFVDRLSEKLLDFRGRFLQNIENRIEAFSVQIK